MVYKSICTECGANRVWNLLWSFTLFIAKCFILPVFKYCNVFFNHKAIYKNLNRIFSRWFLYQCTICGNWGLPAVHH